MNVKNKWIIHNYTDISDFIIFDYIKSVVSEGRISEDKYGSTYCFATTFPFSGNVVVTCERASKNTYTFRIYKEKDNGCASNNK